MRDEGKGQGQVVGVLLSHAKGCLLSEEGRKEPLESFEEESDMVCAVEGPLWLLCGIWIGKAGRKVTWKAKHGVLQEEGQCE